MRKHIQYNESICTTRTAEQKKVTVLHEYLSLILIEKTNDYHISETLFPNTAQNMGLEAAFDCSLVVSKGYDSLMAVKHFANVRQYISLKKKDFQFFGDGHFKINDPDTEVYIAYGAKGINITFLEGENTNYSKKRIVFNFGRTTNEALAVGFGLGAGYAFGNLNNHEPFSNRFFTITYTSGSMWNAQENVITCTYSAQLKNKF